MANTYNIGDTIREEIALLSTGSTAIDPSGLTFYLKPPDGSVTPYAWNSSTLVVRRGVGDFYFDVLTTADGSYEYRWTSTGVAAQTVEGWFFVRPRRVST